LHHEILSKPVRKQEKNKQTRQTPQNKNAANNSSNFPERSIRQQKPTIDL